MQGLSPDLFNETDGEPTPGSPYARSAIERLTFTLKLRERGYRDTPLLRAFELVPRESFAPRRYADLARRDMALPLSCGQTMTAPHVLARVLALLAVGPRHRVLEVGTGSGYFAAVLSHLAGEVLSLERFGSLAVEARGKLRGQSIDNVETAHADGLAPFRLGRFDRIVLNGRIEAWPDHLVAALAPEGRMLAPVGEAGEARWRLLIRTGEGDASEAAHEAADLSPLRPGLAATL